LSWIPTGIYTTLADKYPREGEDRNDKLTPNPSLLGREGRTRSAGVSSKTKALPKFRRTFGILLCTCLPADRLLHFSRKVKKIIMINNKTKNHQ